MKFQTPFRALKALATATALLAAPAAAQQPPLEVVRDLTQLDSWGVPARTQGLALLPTTLWRETPAAEAEAAFAALPIRFASPALRRIALRVGASAGPAPLGADADKATAQDARLAALAQIGAFAELADILANAPDLNARAGVQARTQAANLTAGKTEEACAIIRGRDAPAEDVGYWLKLRTLCFVAIKEADAAGLTAELALQASPGDEWFFRAVSAAAGRGGDRPPARYDSLLHAAASILAQLPEPESGADFSSPVVALMAAQNPATRPNARREAVARAFEAGLLAPPIVRDILQSLPAPGASPRGRKSTPGNALHASLRAMQTATTPQARVAAGIDLVKDAPHDGARLARAQLVLFQLGAIPRDAVGEDALKLARIALIAGDQGQARFWAANAPASWDSARINADLALAANASTAATAQELIRAAGDVSTQTARAARLLAIADALGADIGAEGREFLRKASFAPGKRLAPAQSGPAFRAAAQGQAGLAGLRIAALFGEGQPREHDIGDVLAVLGALRASGFDVEARALAIEAAGGAGPLG